MTEKQIHKNICIYLKMQFPNLIFTSDMSGLRTSIGVAVNMKALRSSRGIPDLLIFEPRQGYNGLLIEIKIKKEKLYKKDGTFRTEHLKEQFEMIKRLKEKGYYAVFGFGFDDCKEIIDNYMK